MRSGGTLKKTSTEGGGRGQVGFVPRLETAEDLRRWDDIGRQIRFSGNSRPTDVTASLLLQDANGYGVSWDVADEGRIDEGGMTPRIDMAKAALFEATIETAFLVASADGALDDDARAVFQSIFVAACAMVAPGSMFAALLLEMSDQLAEDGLEQRARMIASALPHPLHRLEALRIAALSAHVPGTVSPQARSVLEALARELGLPAEAVQEALQTAASALHL